MHSDPCAHRWQFLSTNAGTPALVMKLGAAGDYTVAHDYYLLVRVASPHTLHTAAASGCVLCAYGRHAHYQPSLSMMHKRLVSLCVTSVSADVRVARHVAREHCW